jgi:hypothetical protein
MSKELKHADVIVHMAKHGFESVEGRDRLHEPFYNAGAIANPITRQNSEWRIKPATITYTVTVPEPLRVMPEKGQTYFIVGHDGVYPYKFDSDDIDDALFALGNIWDTEAKAQQAFDALFGPLKGKA